ncbi:hypothetical protein FKP32DRAFT_1600707, partial [Trametes sanguinea]
ISVTSIVQARVGRSVVYVVANVEANVEALEYGKDAQSFALVIPLRTSIRFAFITSVHTISVTSIVQARVGRSVVYVVANVEANVEVGDKAELRLDARHARICIPNRLAPDSRHLAWLPITAR